MSIASAGTAMLAEAPMLGMAAADAQASSP